jgi:hypothetical protein
MRVCSFSDQINGIGKALHGANPTTITVVVGSEYIEEHSYSQVPPTPNLSSLRNTAALIIHMCDTVLINCVPGMRLQISLSMRSMLFLFSAQGLTAGFDGSLCFARAMGAEDAVLFAHQAVVVDEELLQLVQKLLA